MSAEAVEYLRANLPAIPRVAVVLGSGLGAFAEELEDRTCLPYSRIPGWPQSTAIGHAGMLVYGKLAGLDLLVMSGRAHLYEGYTAAEAVFGVRAMGRLGVRSLVLTNAAGGINEAYRQGALVLISDHINLQGTNPLVGPNEETLGPRFPDMSDAYCAQYRETAKAVAAELGIPLPEGVYAGLLGPSYETPAEIRFLRAIGADLVGMSTVPEAIAANHMGMKVVAISCVTNMAAGIVPGRISHDEVLETGRAVRATFLRLLRGLLPRLAQERR